MVGRPDLLTFRGENSSTSTPLCQTGMRVASMPCSFAHQSAEQRLDEKTASAKRRQVPSIIAPVRKNSESSAGQPIVCANITSGPCRWIAVRTWFHSARLTRWNHPSQAHSGNSTRSNGFAVFNSAITPATAML